jgi:hypothetical protein
MSSTENNERTTLGAVAKFIVPWQYMNGKSQMLCCNLLKILNKQTLLCFNLSNVWISRDFLASIFLISGIKGDRFASIFFKFLKKQSTLRGIILE